MCGNEGAHSVSLVPLPVGHWRSRVGMGTVLSMVTASGRVRRVGTTAGGER